jgi:hypothetical protein
VAAAFERLHDGRDLHEIRPRAGDETDSH